MLWELFLYSSEIKIQEEQQLSRYSDRPVDLVMLEHRTKDLDACYHVYAPMVTHYPAKKHAQGCDSSFLKGRQNKLYVLNHIPSQ